MWKRLTHPNIVPFKGITLDPLQIVSEWMSGGDLTGYISLNPQANRIDLVSLFWSLPRTTASLHCQLVNVATGLNYLHQREVIHGDLKGVGPVIAGLSSLTQRNFVAQYSG